MEYTAKIKGAPVSKSNSYRIIRVNGHSELSKSDAMKRYEEAFMWQVGAIRGANIKSMFEFYIDVYYPSKRSDLDGCLKAVLDCLQKAKVITNDNNCCLIHARKFIDKDDPRIEFRIVTLE